MCLICCFTVEVNHTATTTPSPPLNENIQDNKDIPTQPDAGQYIPGGNKNTDPHSSLTSSTPSSTARVPQTPPPTIPHVLDEKLWALLTPTTRQHATTTPASKITLSSQKPRPSPSDNQTTLEGKTPLPGKPSISANKSILVTNSIVAEGGGEESLTTQSSFSREDTATGYLTDGDTQTGFSDIYNPGDNNGPLHSHQGLHDIATTDSSDNIQEYTSPKSSSVLDGDFSDRTHIQSGIDPGGSNEKQNRSSHLAGVTSDNLYEPSATDVPGIGDVDKPQTRQPRGHEKNFINGVRYIYYQCYEPI